MTKRMAPPIATERETDHDAEAAGLPLFVWLSPGFPVGGFAYSHGLEGAVETGDVTDAASLAGWMADLFAHGAPANDAILLAQSWHAATARDAAAVAALNALALALAPSQERHLETSAQGTAFVAAVRAAWSCAALDLLPDAGALTAYPVAVGVAAAGHGIALAPTLRAFGLGFCAALVSAAVRLSCVGQTEAQQVIAGCMAPVRRVANHALRSGLDDLGSFVPYADIGSMRHETQYSRLFRS